MRSLVAWFVKNPVAANLLMIVIIVGGLITVATLRQEVFPEINTDLITASVVYPGAAPEEVEEGVVARLEEAIEGIEGIKRITGTAAENVGTVTAELLPGIDARKVLEDIKSKVDAIDTFPEEAEQPVVKELIIRRQVINVTVSGDADERSLKSLGEGVRDDLAALPEITQVELAAARPYEISIEISEDALRRYDLTFDEVAAAVRRGSLDLPGGSIRTEAGEILLRTKGQAYRGRELEDIPLRTAPDGRRLTIGDVARVNDGFADTDQKARFDGKPAVVVQVFRVGEQDAIQIADAVKAYVDTKQARMPSGISLTVWQDDTLILRSRLSTLIRNGRAGFALVFLILALFLRFRLAGWVAAGIPVSFLGGMALMPGFDISINLVSLFAFIVVLGIVVDDAIVVGENIYRHHRKLGKEGAAAAIDGATEIAMPVVFAVLTTIAAFAPLTAIPGSTGKFMKVIPIIVISVLIFSLVESLLILPAHLSHLKHEPKKATNPGLWHRFQRRFAQGLERFALGVYGPALKRAVHFRYLSVAIAVALLLTIGGIVRGGWISFTFFPPVEADNVVALLTMPQGTPADRTADALAGIEAAALELQHEIEQETGDDAFRHLLASTGEQPFRTAQSQGGGGVGSSFSGAHLGEVNIELVGSESRNLTSSEIAARWRAKVGQIPDATELTYTASIFSTGSPIDIQLTGGNLETLQSGANWLKEELRSYPGVLDIADSFRAGKDEIKLAITPEAQALGLSLSDLARQTRQAFYGEEAQRIQRGRDDVKVMVRYPEAERRSLGDLDAMRVRAPGGIEVPFAVAGRATQGKGFSSIQRVDRRRTVHVTADVDLEVTNANEVIAALEANVLPRMAELFPGVGFSFEGEQEQQRETMGGLKRGFAIALLVIYALLAIPFRSYWQPLIVMSAIPFGLIGAIGGHLLLGLDLTMLSMFGIVALTGVVVNDSLVMVDFINREVQSGLSLTTAIHDAGTVRFRPILLTSLTTFFGLLPLILETSVQAQFLIPMAVSLAFGVLFATFITLLLVPVLYAILEDAKATVLRLRSQGDASAKTTWSDEEAENWETEEGLV